MATDLCQVYGSTEKKVAHLVITHAVNVRTLAELSLPEEPSEKTHPVGYCGIAAMKITGLSR